MGFDYFMLGTYANIQEGFLARTWGEDNAANLNLFNVFLFPVLVMSLLVKLGSQAPCSVPWP